MHAVRQQLSHLRQGHRDAAAAMATEPGTPADSTRGVAAASLLIGVTGSITAHHVERAQGALIRANADRSR